jgi:long-chain acyl-CoA synthetase
MSTEKKHWLKSYPEGVPETIDADQYGSLNHLFEESFQKFAARRAYVCMGRYMRYSELDAYSRNLAAWLQQRGLGKGARVAVMMPNVLQYPIAVTAILRAGCTVVNINPLYTPRELKHQLNDAGVEAIIILENFAITLEKVLPQTSVKHVLLATVGDMMGLVNGSLMNLVVRKVKKLVPDFDLPSAVSFRSALTEGAKLSLRAVDLTPADIAFLQYTGGTTGLSKGATLTHRNVLANMLQNDAWAGPAMREESAKGALVTVCALPLYHILALNACMLMGMRWGAMNLMIPNPRDMEGFVKELAKYRVNFFPGVNTLFNGLLNQAGFDKLDFSGLRITLGGGMAVQEVVSARWNAATGSPILEGYGLSETSQTATLCPPDQSTFSGTIGLPVPSTEVAILDDDGQPVPHGHAGEIAIRGPQVMVGYWNRPDETAKVMTSDGYFKSGDVGIMDESGYVKIVDRKKDMILVSGFNVYPNEIEAVVAAHPDVLECACIGVPDANSGEAVKLFVVRKNPALTTDQLMSYCKEQLTAYKKPKYIEFRQTLPKTNVGKILRRELRDTPIAAG